MIPRPEAPCLEQTPRCVPGLVESAHLAQECVGLLVVDGFALDWSVHAIEAMITVDLRGEEPAVTISIC